MGKRLVLALEVFTDEEGGIDARFDTELDERAAVALVEAVLDQMDADADRAQQVGAWGAGRRRHV